MKKKFFDEMKMRTVRELNLEVRFEYTKTQFGPTHNADGSPGDPPDGGLESMTVYLVKHNGAHEVFLDITEQLSFEDFDDIAGEVLEYARIKHERQPGTGVHPRPAVWSP